jgi:hypothetical protein
LDKHTFKHNEKVYRKNDRPFHCVYYENATALSLVNFGSHSPCDLTSSFPSLVFAFHNGADIHPAECCVFQLVQGIWI